MIHVTKVDKLTGRGSMVEIKEGVDPFAVVAQVVRSLGLSMIDPDQEYDAVIAARDKPEPKPAPKRGGRRQGTPWR